MGKYIELTFTQCGKVQKNNSEEKNPIKLYYVM